jgi:hypothetical protein
VHVDVVITQIGIDHWEGAGRGAATVGVHCQLGVFTRGCLGLGRETRPTADMPDVGLSGLEPSESERDGRSLAIGARRDLRASLHVGRETGGGDNGGGPVTGRVGCDIATRGGRRCRRSGCGVGVRTARDQNAGNACRDNC